MKSLQRQRDLVGSMKLPGCDEFLGVNVLKIGT